MITDVPGVRAGHWTGAGTGVTAVLAPAGSVGAAEVRGGAPATREVVLLEQGALVDTVDAIVLTGGSAFGLAAADGVVAFLRDRGQGFPTRAGPVPIVGAAAVFDLVASQGAFPDAAAGRAAAEEAERGEPLRSGAVGAGTGATVGKWRGADHAVAGGCGGASQRVGDVTIGALAIVNAVGDVYGADGARIAGSSAPETTAAFPALEEGVNPLENTTLIVVATDAEMTKPECHLVAQSAHDGLARAVHPTHSRFDGDVAFVIATGATAGGPVDRLRVGVVDVVADAVRDAVRARAAPEGRS